MCQFELRSKYRDYDFEVLLMPPPSNFIVSFSIMTKFGVVIEFDKLPPKSPKTSIKMMSLQSCDVIFCFRLPYPLKFRNSLFLGHGMNSRL